LHSPEVSDADEDVWNNSLPQSTRNRSIRMSSSRLQHCMLKASRLTSYYVSHCCIRRTQHIGRPPGRFVLFWQFDWGKLAAGTLLLIMNF